MSSVVVPGRSGSAAGRTPSRSRPAGPARTPPWSQKRSSSAVPNVSTTMSVPVGVDAELLLPVDVDQPAGADLGLHRGVDLEGRLTDRGHLGAVERRELERFVEREEPVDRLELGRDLEVGLGERDRRTRASSPPGTRGPSGRPSPSGPGPTSSRRGSTGRSPRAERGSPSGGGRGSGASERPGPASPASRSGSRGGGNGAARPGGSRCANQKAAVRAERLPLVGDLARDVLVEHRDVVRESELELGRVRPRRLP